MVSIHVFYNIEHVLCTYQQLDTPQTICVIRTFVLAAIAVEVLFRLDVVLTSQWITDCVIHGFCNM